MCRNCSDRAGSLSNFLDKALYYSFIIRGLFEGYQVITLSVLIGLYHLSFDTTGTKVMSYACLTLGLLLLLAPYLIICYFLANFENLNDRRLRQRFDTIYKALRLKSGRAAFLQPAFFVFRRLILGIAVVVFRKVLIAQICLVWLQTTLAFVIFGYTRPFVTRTKLRIQVFNEIVLMCVLYAMMCLSNLVLSAETKVFAGYSVCGFIALHLVCSVIILTIFTFVKARRSFWIYSAKKKQTFTRVLTKEALVLSRIKRKLKRKQMKDALEK